MKKLLVPTLLLNAFLLAIRAWQEMPSSAALSPDKHILENGDANGDGRRDISDAVYLLEWLFSGGQEPVAIAQGSSLTSEQADILSHLSLVDLDTGNGGKARTIRLTAANLQIVNGLGATNGNPEDPRSGASATNGVGNLIVGYEEPRDIPGDPTAGRRTGSHNIVVGAFHEYTSFGGLVAGNSNTVSAPYASVTGGTNNTASGQYASVSGGAFNAALASGCSVSGGGRNTAGVSWGQEEGYSSVSGGYQNSALGSYCSVSGGSTNESREYYSSVSGGFYNFANHYASSVSGGAKNTADGETASVSGGVANIATGAGASITGGGGSIEHPEGGNKATGKLSTVTGGFFNTAGGESSVVSGGFGHEASEQFNWVAGGLSESE